MLRKWLRDLIGWHEVGAALQAQRDYVVSLEELIQAQGKEIAELKGVAKRREDRRQPDIRDWEMVQAAFASDPQNYKEDA